MGNARQDLLSLIGRLLLALMFVIEGSSKIGEFQGTVGYIASGGLPLPTLVALLTIALELGGGLALIVGYKARWAALAFAVFTLLASLLFHNFWAVPAGEKMTQYLFFMKNISVAGGMLVLAAFGPGRWSLDGRDG
jgi:putative oxidoreductase